MRVILLLLLFINFANSQEFEEWISKSGSKIRAKLHNFDKEALTLIPDRGKIITIKRSQLSEESLIKVYPKTPEPFGFKAGMTIKQIQAKGVKLKLVQAPNTYLTNDLIKKHSSFQSCYLDIDPKEGLISVTGVGYPIEDYGNGYNTNEEFTKVYLSLKNKYRSIKPYRRTFSSNSEYSKKDILIILINLKYGNTILVN